MSPEMWERESYDTRTDVWAIGCILYEMCTNEPVFKGRSLKELKENIMEHSSIELPTQYQEPLKLIFKKYSFKTLLIFKLIQINGIVINISKRKITYNIEQIF